MASFIVIKGTNISNNTIVSCLSINNFSPVSGHKVKYLMIQFCVQKVIHCKYGKDQLIESSEQIHSDYRTY